MTRKKISKTNKASKATKRMNRAKSKDEEQQEAERRSIKQKADKVNTTNYGPPEVIYNNELDPEDIKKQTCDFCGNRFPNELSIVTIKRKNKRICVSPSCRTLVRNLDRSIGSSKPTVIINKE